MLTEPSSLGNFMHIFQSARVCVCVFQGWVWVFMGWADRMGPDVTESEGRTST
jgi:hypothetical protein